MQEVIKKCVKVMGLTLLMGLPLFAQFQMPFSDNFNDGDDSDWSWYIDIGPHPAGQPSHEVVNGVERIVTHDQNNTLLANGTSTLSNYYVEADMKIVQLLDDGYGGLRLYAYNNGGIGYNSTYYVLDICHRDHYWKLYVHYQGGTGEVLAQGALNTNLNQWYHMKLEVRGDTVYGYLDGQLLGSGVPSNPLSGGYFGIGGSDDVIEVDNIHADYILQNQPPTASIPSGPSSGNVGQSLTYSSTVTDPDGDQVYVQFDWGDGSMSDWIGPYPSGQPNNASHIWDAPGTYFVKARGKDSHGNVGAWSQSSEVTINVIRVWIDDTTGHVGDTLDIPIIIADVSGLDVYSVEINICVDTSLLIPLTINKGSITSSWNLTSNITDTCILTSMAGATPLNSGGDLMWVRYYVNPSAQVGDSTEIRITHLLLNEGNPPSMPDGGVFVVLPNVYEISGHVTYAFTNVPVPNTQILVNGTAATITDQEGFYSVQEDYGNSCVIKPEKIADVGSSTISAYDASLILRYTVGLIDLDPIQKIAADVSGNGSVAAFDASYILRYSVHLINKFPVMEDSLHFWRFCPKSFPLNSYNWSSAPDSIVYPPLTSDQIGQDYFAIIYGDVSHNWSSNGKPSKYNDIPRGEILLQDINGTPGDTLYIPIRIKNAKNVFSLNIRMPFDPQIFVPISVSKGELSQDFDLSYNIHQNDLYIAMAGASSINGDGTIGYIKIKVNANADHGRVELITLNDIVLNEKSYRGNPKAKLTIGETINFGLSDGYPNPSRSDVLIKYSVPYTCNVSISIYNVSGQKVKTLVNKEVKPGSYKVTWDGTNSRNQKVAEGTYFCIMESDRFRAIKKIVFLGNSK